MKTFEEYLESKIPGRTVRNFSDMMKLIKSYTITKKDRFEIAGYTYRLSKLSSNYYLGVYGNNDEIFKKLVIDKKAVAYHLYKDRGSIDGRYYPESTNVQDCLKLMAYCYAVHEELIINAPLLIEQSIEQFNVLYERNLYSMKSSQTN